ncbi:TIGR03560 family F420-dependent LLM class oxidoreductase [Actinoplanes sp. NPDC089786]|uniref:TIGR03560 family F420-dependent LLM class oxidoreductase n=1 Tax=Actinoplanes sp. NPDC089786 TaxID=3155185 RepID=UPI003447EC6B
MRLVTFIEPQLGATYDQQRRVAQLSEDLGFDGFFRSDHFTGNSASDDRLPGPTDSWVTLGAIAVQTSRIRIGTLVSSATFRLPGPLAISVAQVDEMSGGRVELGLGGGWLEREHTAYGIPFPPTGERLDRLEEQLEIVTGLWTADGPYTFQGRHYQLADSPALPKPVQTPRPPVIVGGKGKKRTPALAARFADEFNAPFSSLTEASALFDLVREACTAAGRTSAPAFSAAVVLCVGRDEAELAHRANAIGRSVDDLRTAGDAVAGTVDEVVDKLGRWGEAGAGRMFLQTLDLSDLHHLELVASGVAPQLS